MNDLTSDDLIFGEDLNRRLLFTDIINLIIPSPIKYVDINQKHMLLLFIDCCLGQS